MLLIVFFCMAVKVDAPKEIIFGSSDPIVPHVLSKNKKDGESRKLAPRIYSTNLKWHRLHRTDLKGNLAACNAHEEPSQAKHQIIVRTIL